MFTHKSLPDQPIPLRKSRGKREPRFLLPFSGLLGQIPCAHPANRRDRPCFPQATRPVAPFCLFSRAIPKTWKVRRAHTSRVRIDLNVSSAIILPFVLIEHVGGRERQCTSGERSRRSWPDPLLNKRELSRQPIVTLAQRRRADIREDPLFPMRTPGDCPLGTFCLWCNRTRQWSVSWRTARPKLITKFNAKIRCKKYLYLILYLNRTRCFVFL